MEKLVLGMKVTYGPQPEWGVGHLVALHDDGNKAEVAFPARAGGSVLVSTKGGALRPHQLSVNDAIRSAKGRAGIITGEEPGGRGLRRYVVRYDDGEEDELPESEVRAEPPRPDLLSSLKEGRAGDGRNFLLRRGALTLDDERRCDALGALLASRVMVKPHQIGVVQRVLASRRPRFILADEVGLGKTIEAGMVFSALRLSGLATRVLVVAPSHLTVQWLGELYHKFSHLFTLLDSERYALAVREQPDTSPWARFPKVICSLELLSRGEEHLRQAAAPEAFWDLVIIDEAHHLKGEKAFLAAQALAKNSWGLLLLTATPMQLDVEEYHRLLLLIDPAAAPTVEALRARMERQEAVSDAARAILEKRDAKVALSRLAKKFPEDKRLGSLSDPEELLSHLAETYSLSEHLIRNRRAVVGGFSQRRLRRHPVSMAEAELSKRQAIWEKLSESGLRGAPLAGLLRRLESSPAALSAALSGTKALQPLASSISLPGRDAKWAAFFQLLQDIWKGEPQAKVLVFTESRDTLEYLQEELRKERVEALGYHGELQLLERDRQVARFRDPEGPKVLICTEVGGEGRNFQFSHHLVNYDLPWSPATMEQRIGRLDRIGQTRPVEVHVFDAPGTFSSEVLSLLADAVGVFEETVGGLDALLEEVEPRLVELALAGPDERAAYAKELSARVREVRAQMTRAYDPLLDLRSFDRPAVDALVKRAIRRMRLEEDEESSLEDGMWAVSRDLDERLEETVTQLARKVGIGVDTDEQVEAFQCAFHFGHELKVEALPGISLADKTVLGTFWRDTAVEQEEIEYFATGHAIVEALFGFLRDGPYGRNGARFIEKRSPVKAKGIEFLFHIQTPEPEDTSAGAKVPSRQLARFLERLLIRLPVAETALGVKVDLSLLPLLDEDGRSLKGDEIRAAFPGLSEFVPQAAAAALAAAQGQVREQQKVARKAIEAERDAALSRLSFALAHQGLSPGQREAQLSAERGHYESLLEAISGLRVALDSACAFIINR